MVSDDRLGNWGGTKHQGLGYLLCPLERSSKLASNSEEALDNIKHGDIQGNLDVAPSHKKT